MACCGVLCALRCGVPGLGGLVFAHVSIGPLSWALVACCAGLVALRLNTWSFLAPVALDAPGYSRPARSAGQWRRLGGATIVALGDQGAAASRKPQVQAAIISKPAWRATRAAP